MVPQEDEVPVKQRMAQSNVQYTGGPTSAMQGTVTPPEMQAHSGPPNRKQISLTTNQMQMMTDQFEEIAGVLDNTAAVSMISQYWMKCVQIVFSFGFYERKQPGQSNYDNLNLPKQAIDFFQYVYTLGNFSHNSHLVRSGSVNQNKIEQGLINLYNSELTRIQLRNRAVKQVINTAKTVIEQKNIRLDQKQAQEFLHEALGYSLKNQADEGRTHDTENHLQSQVFRRLKSVKQSTHPKQKEALQSLEKQVNQYTEDSIKQYMKHVDSALGSNGSQLNEISQMKRIQNMQMEDMVTMSDLSKNPEAAKFLKSAPILRNTHQKQRLFSAMKGFSSVISDVTNVLQFEAKNSNDTISIQGTTNSLDMLLKTMHVSSKNIAKMVSAPSKQELEVASKLHVSDQKKFWQQKAVTAGNQLLLMNAQMKAASDCTQAIVAQVDEMRKSSIEESMNLAKKLQNNNLKDLAQKLEKNSIQMDVVRSTVIQNANMTSRVKQDILVAAHTLDALQSLEQNLAKPMQKADVGLVKETIKQALSALKSDMLKGNQSATQKAEENLKSITMRIIDQQYSDDPHLKQFKSKIKDNVTSEQVMKSLLAMRDDAIRSTVKLDKQMGSKQQIALNNLNRVKQLQNNIQSMRKSLARDLESKQQQFTKKIKQLQDINRKSKLQLQESERDHRIKLEGKSQSIKQKESQMMTKKSQLASKTREINAIKQESREATEKAELLSRQSAKLRIQADEFKSKFKSANMENQEHKRKLDAARSAIDQAERVKNAQISKVHHLNAQLIQANRELATSRSNEIQRSIELDSVRTNVIQLNNTISNTKSELLKMKEEKQDFNMSIKNLTNLNIAEKAQTERLRIQINNLQSSKFTQAEQTRKFKLLHESSEANVKRITNEGENLTRRITRLEKDSSQYLLQNQRLKESITSKESQITKSKNQLRSTKSERDNALEASQRKQAEVTSLNNKIKICNEKLKLVANLQEQLVEAKANSLKLSAQYTINIQELNRTIDENQSQIRNINDQLSKGKREIMDVRSELAFKEEQITKLQAAKSRIEKDQKSKLQLNGEQLEKSEKLVKSLKKQIQLLKKSADQTKQYQSVLKEKKSLQLRFAQLTQDVNSQKEKVIETEALLDKAKADLRRAQTKTLQAETQMQSWKASQLKALHSGYDKKMDELSKKSLAKQQQLNKNYNKQKKALIAQHTKKTDQIKARVASLQQQSRRNSEVLTKSNLESLEIKSERARLTAQNQNLQAQIKLQQNALAELKSNLLVHEKELAEFKANSVKSTEAKISDQGGKWQAKIDRIQEERLRAEKQRTHYKILSQQMEAIGKTYQEKNHTFQMDKLDLQTKLKETQRIITDHQVQLKKLRGMKTQTEIQRQLIIQFISNSGYSLDSNVSIKVISQTINHQREQIRRELKANIAIMQKLQETAKHYDDRITTIQLENQALKKEKQSIIQSYDRRIALINTSAKNIQIRLQEYAQIKYTDSMEFFGEDTEQFNQVYSQTVRETIERIEKGMHFQFDKFMKFKQKVDQNVNTLKKGTGKKTSKQILQHIINMEKQFKQSEEALRKLRAEQNEAFSEDFEQKIVQHTNVSKLRELSLAQLKSEEVRSKQDLIQHYDGLAQTQRKDVKTQQIIYAHTKKIKHEFIRQLIKSKQMEANETKYLNQHSDTLESLKTSISNCLDHSKESGIELTVLQSYKQVEQANKHMHTFITHLEDNFDKMVSLQKMTSKDELQLRNDAIKNALSTVLSKSFEFGKNIVEKTKNRVIDQMKQRYTIKEQCNDLIKKCEDAVHEAREQMKALSVNLIQTNLILKFKS